VFADVEPTTLLIDLQMLKKNYLQDKSDHCCRLRGSALRLSSFEGHRQERRLALVDDACHALGAIYKGQPVGSINGLERLQFSSRQASLQVKGDDYHE
jgi:dTDP-4-amino-4,6-dideoxygalactose transaminase